MLAANVGSDLNAPWRNSLNPHDVDHSSSIGPTDAILIINYLNAQRPAQLPAEYTPPAPYYDVDGSNSVGPADAVLVINVLNAPIASPSQQSPSSSSGLDAAQLLVDINLTAAGVIAVGPIIDVNGIAYFGGRINEGNVELWRSDGTASGTRLVRNVELATNQFLVNVNGVLFFSGNDGVNGFELWKSDGTESGTVLVKNIEAGANGSAPTPLANVNGVLLFATAGAGASLWRSDGTADGTVLVSNVSTYAGTIFVAPRFGVIGNTLYFTGYNGATGSELWRSDGTAAGTALVRDIWPGPTSSEIESFTNVNGTLFFTAIDGTHGYELWKSDGTTVGTVLVKELLPGANNSTLSRPRDLASIRGELFFRGSDGISGSELWKSDGTSAGTVLFKDIRTGPLSSYPSNLVNVNGSLYFSASDGRLGISQIWKSDGTTAGMTLVKEVSVGASLSSPLRYFTNVNGTVFFTAGRDLGNYQLWMSDGTSAGTVLINDRTGSNSRVGLRHLVNVDSRVFFIANDAIDRPLLWFSDGTVQGTRQVARDSVSTGSAINSTPLVIDNVAYFAAANEVHGMELWKTDGTAAGTVLVKDMVPGNRGAYPKYLTNVNGRLFFGSFDGSRSTGLWVSDGTSAGTFNLNNAPLRPTGIGANAASPLTNVNGTLVYVANAGANGAELWKSDGTVTGTSLVRDIRPGSDGSFPTGLVNVNGTLYFVANDGVNGTELWKSNGTTSGTLLVKNIRAGSGNADPRYLVSVGGTLFFTATDGTNSAVWKSDGTAGGTVQLKIIRAETTNSPGGILVNVNGTLFFAVHQGYGFSGLWKSNGTAAGTVLVRNLSLATSSIATVGNTLFFTASEFFSSGIELWRSDGTTGGTEIVRDIYPGAQTSVWPAAMTNVNGRLYFSMDDGLSGRELWVTNGTASGTKQIADIAAGSQGSSPSGFFALNDQVFFVTDDLQHGRELWILTPQSNLPPSAVSENYSLDEDKSIGTAAPGLLANDTDSDGDVLTAVLFAGPANGTLTLSFSGAFSYSPASNFHGVDSFTYRASDGVVTSAVATVTLTVVAVNDVPVARFDQYLIAENAVLTVTAPGLLNNDADADSGDTKSVITAKARLKIDHLLWDETQSGDLSHDFDQVFTLRNGTNELIGVTGVPSAAPADFDGFIIEVPVGAQLTAATVSTRETVGRLESAYWTVRNGPTLAFPEIAEVLVPIPVDRQAILNDQLPLGPGRYRFRGSGLIYAAGYTPSFADYAFSFTVSGASDADIAEEALPASGGPPISMALGTQYTLRSGTLLTVHSDGSFRFDSNGKYRSLSVSDSANESFTYTMADSSGALATATVTIFVRGVNDAPVAADDTFSTLEGTPLTVTAPGALANDSDQDGDSLTAVLLSDPANGSLNQNADGSFVYTPNQNFSGPDSFTYRASDSTAFSNVATVTVQVQSVNHAPVATNDDFTLVEDNPLAVAASGLLANDTDLDGDVLAAELLTGPVSGTLVLSPNGAFSYVPAANFFGVDSFTYRASDGEANSNVATVTLSVSPVNDAPEAFDNSYASGEDTLLILPEPGILTNDSDAEGDVLAATLEAGPPHGTLTLFANGSFVYSPDANFHGVDSFTYRASDLFATSNTATVTLSINPINDAPVALGDGYAVAQDTTIDLPAPGVLANDSDIDGGVLTAVIASGPAHGTLSLGASGGFSYQPNSGFVGAESFAYRASDGTLESSLATVLIDVQPTAVSPWTAQLIKDINLAPGGVQVHGSSLVDFQGTAYFAGSTGGGDIELWRSDGTTAGTRRVRDIRLGPKGSNPTSLTAVGGFLYFAADDGASGYELWKSDGTESGTVLVRELQPGLAGSFPRNLTNVNGSVFFVASDGGSGYELWKSDGSFAGTLLVKDIRPGLSSSSPNYLTNVGGQLFFAANDGVSGNELWTSNGTPGGTTLVKDIRPGQESIPQIRELTNVGGTVFFRHDDGTRGPALWKSNGTDGGTVLVKDLQSGGQGSQLQTLTAVGTKLFFFTSDGVLTNNRLWISDGTEQGTVQLTNPGQLDSGTQQTAAVNDKLFFFGISGLWTSDGTAEGTTRIRPPNTPGGPAANRYLTNVNGTLLFQGSDGPQGRELWKSNGTTAGTALVKDTIEGREGGNPRLLTNVGGKLFFAAGDGTGGLDLWVSDSTGDGTSRVLLNNGVTASAAPSAAVVVGNVAYFAATDAEGGRELWKTNGTAAGTVRVADIVPGPSGSRPRDLTNVGGTLFFTANDLVSGLELWKSDGSAAGTVRVKDISPGPFSSSPLELIHFGGKLFFVANDGTSGNELWQSDGTADGTTLVADLRASGSSDPRELTDVGNTLYFRANNGTSGVELWKSDGTAAGTVLMRDIQTGTGSSFPSFLTNVNGMLFFAATASASGVELWKSDGTAAGTVLVRDIRAGAFSGLPRYLTEVNGKVFLRASDATSGGELWHSDGTEEGTALVRDIRPGLNESAPAYLTNVGGTLFFAATSSGGNVELWKSDGTAAGTQLVVEIVEGAAGSFPALLTNVGGTLFFTAETAASGRELWQSDGTSLGTQQVADIAAGDASSLPSDLIDFFGRPLFTADDRQHGRELWIAFDASANHAPVAAHDSYSTNEITPLVISAPGLLANDFDADGDALQVVSVAGPSHGVLTLDADGSFSYEPEPFFSGLDSFSYRATDGVAVSAVTVATIMVTPVNDAPVVLLGGGRGASEGSEFLAGGFFTDPDSSVWTATVDYGDGGGSQPLALSAAGTFALSHVYLDNGAYSVTVVITDGDGAAQTATLVAEIANALPQIVAFTGPALASRGQTVTFAGTFTDAGIADTHVARIQWGDGTFSQLQLGGTGAAQSFSASHVYQVGGVFNPTVTITDDDGGAASLAAELLVAGSRLHQGVLQIVGSSLADTITVANIRGGLEVFGSIGGVTVSQSFAPGSVERIVALLGAGNDNLTVSSTVAVPVLIDGGNGADTLFAGAGRAIILGGSGNDSIRGGSQRDLIVGGFGADQINASSGGDLLISGRTIYDADFAALEAILAEWSAAGTYQERTSRLRDGTGSSVQPLGIKLTHNQTVFDDTVADTLWGGSELDWFFYDPTRDQPLDKLATEINR